VRDTRVRAHAGCLSVYAMPGVSRNAKQAMSHRSDAQRPGGYVGPLFMLGRVRGWSPWRIGRCVISYSLPATTPFSDTGATNRRAWVAKPFAHSALSSPWAVAASQMHRDGFALPVPRNHDRGGGIGNAPWLILPHGNAHLREPVVFVHALAILSRTEWALAESHRSRIRTTLPL